jgi:hypothetical protein
MRRLLIFIGALFVVASVGAGAFQLLALAATHKYSVRASYTGIRTLQVDTSEGDVHLTGAPAGSPVTVVENVSESFAAARRRAENPRPGALRLTYTCPSDASENIACRVSYDVTVPAGLQVTVNTDAGDVHATGLDSSQISLESGEGDVSATGLDSSEINLQTGEGDISATLRRPAANLRASSGEGSVTLMVPDVSYAVSASTGEGTVSYPSLTIDPHSLRRIDASSREGDVTISAAP